MWSNSAMPWEIAERALLAITAIVLSTASVNGRLSRARGQIPRLARNKLSKKSKKRKRKRLYPNQNKRESSMRCSKPIPKKKAPMIYLRLKTKVKHIESEGSVHFQRACL